MSRALWDKRLPVACVRSWNNSAIPSSLLLPAIAQKSSTATIYIALTRKGKFLIRQRGNLPFNAKGRRKFIGQSETGRVYEQAMTVTDSQGVVRIFRRIEIQLNEPTRDEAQRLPATEEATRLRFLDCVAFWSDYLFAL